ncbi:FAD binding domain-containing protein [Copromyces sp. CBS 386.78]|nr:FAD binding domain-containing protein [Copromyces sp. CBS 386.78]
MSSPSSSHGGPTSFPTRPTKENPVIIVGTGLSGLVAAFELSRANIPVLLLDQEPRTSLGGQAFWSLGGLFMVNSSFQRRMGIRDSRSLALRDWLSSAQFDRLEKEDYWPRRWAEAFVDFATDDMEDYVKARGLGFLVNVGWGTGPEVVRVFKEPVERKEKEGVVEMRFRHCVDEILTDENGRAVGVKGRVLQDEEVPRGQSSTRVATGEFEIRGAAVIIASGGIGGNLEKVKKNWPIDRLGPKVPATMVMGVPAHVDGRMIDIAEGMGASVINKDRMWHYTEGLKNWDPIWPGHGIRVLPAPSSLWLDATGKRLPPFLFPGCDTLATLKHICSTGYDYSWFICNRTIAAREFALSGSEQNPDITNKSIVQTLRQRVFSSNGTVPVQNFIKHGEDFVVKDNLEDLVAGMNELMAKTDGVRLDYNAIKEEVEARDSQFDNPYSKDAQAMLINIARNYWPDKRSRVAPPHKLLDKKYGPLIAVRMNLLTRKTLGGIETNLSSNVMRTDGTPFPGLYAVGEAAGFGGGGVHGYNSLEGTFLGGCIFSGRAAGRAIVEEVLGTTGLQAKL